MVIYSIPSLIGALIAISLGIFVFQKRLRDLPGRVFFLLMLSCSAWNFGEFMMQSSKSLEEALVWAKLANLGFILIPTFLVRFAYVYPKQLVKEPKILYLFPVALGGLIIFTNKIFSVVPAAGELPFKYVSGELYSLLLVFFFCYMGFAAFLLLAKRLKLEVEKEREQTIHLSIAIVGIVVYILAEGFIGAVIPVILLDSFLALAMACFFTYVTVRYQLFDLRVHIFARRALITLTLLVLLGWLFIALLAFSSAVLSDYFSANPQYFYLGILFVGALLLKKLDSSATFIIEGLFPGLKWKESEVGEVFLIHSEKGILVSHVELNPQIKIDPDLAAGMLSAVQDFLGTALKTGKKKGLNVLSYGGTKLLLEHGAYCYMVIVFSGYELEEMRKDARKVINTISEQYGKVLELWDGDLSKVEGIAPIIEGMFK